MHVVQKRMKKGAFSLIKPASFELQDNFLKVLIWRIVNNTKDYIEFRLVHFPEIMFFLAQNVFQTTRNVPVL